MYSLNLNKNFLYINEKKKQNKKKTKKNKTKQKKNKHFFPFQMKDRVSKFENFLKENELKRRRAIQKYQTEVKLKDQKTKELESLEDELEMLKAQ